jgi:hypothetical protein
MLCDRDGVRPLPWFKAFPMDVVGRKEGRRLSDAETGMMFRIRCELATSLDDLPSLPADPGELAEELGRKPDDVRANLTPEVLFFFRVEEGRIFDDEVIRQKSEVRANREGRRRGAEKTNAKKAASRGARQQEPGPANDGDRDDDRLDDRDGHRDDERTLPSITFSSIPSSSVMASKEGFLPSPESEEAGDSWEDRPKAPGNSQQDRRPAAATATAAAPPARQTNEQWLVDYERRDTDDSRPPVAARVSGHRSGRPPDLSGNPYRRGSRGG